MTASHVSPPAPFVGQVVNRSTLQTAANQLKNQVNMPQDSRRNIYAEESYHPNRFISTTSDKSAHLLVNENGLRRDRRKQADPRPIFMETGMVTRSKGSSYIEIGNTKVICACYGPKQLQTKDNSFCKGVLVCEMKYANFATLEHKSDQVTESEKELSSLVVDALSPCVILDSFPKAQVDIFITILEGDGSVLAASITAASLALADAGIEMYSLAVGASLRQFNEWCLVDPASHEENEIAELGENTGSLTISYMVGWSQISMISQQGYLAQPQLTQGMVTLTEVCKEIYPLMQKALKESVKRKSHKSTTTAS